MGRVRPANQSADGESARPAALSVGAVEHAGYAALPDLLGALMSALPAQDVVFRLDRSTPLSEATVRGTLDMALILGAVPNVGGQAEAVNLEGVLAAARARLGLALLPTAYGVPDGLEEIAPLPRQEAVGLRLVSRHGLDPAIEARAGEALDTAGTSRS